MIIDTGTIVMATNDSPAPGTRFVDTVLLPAQSTAIEPGAFTVIDGQTAVITAYGLVDSQELSIEKVLMTSGTGGGSGACGCPDVAGTVPARVNAVTLCDFSLRVCHEIRVINLPGRYRVVDPLHLTDDDVIVTLSYVEKAALPPQLLFGGS